MSPHLDDDEPLKQSRLRAARILQSRSMLAPVMITSTFQESASSAASFGRETGGSVKRLWVEEKAVKTTYLTFTAFKNSANEEQSP